MIVGVVGFIGSGKGTVGDYLESQWQFQKDSFAKPLKDAVASLFGWDREMIEGSTKESREWREKNDYYWTKVMNKPMSPRLALQLFGTQCMREVFHQDFWTASLSKRYNALKFNTVVTDCRFKNELKCIKDLGGYIIKVKRGDDPKWLSEYIYLMENHEDEKIESLRESGYFPHVSETDWIGSEFDIEISNNSTLNDLYKHTDIAMNIIWHMKKSGQFLSKL
jgi:hypothetical protein